MKTNFYNLGLRVVSPILLLACSSQVYGQSTLISDDFNGSLNTSTWQVLAPLSDSQMTSSGGTAVFLQRGVLVTKADLPAGIEIRGRFAFVGGTYDQFQISLRSDGVLVPPYYPFQNNVYVGLNMRGGDDGNQSGQRNIYLAVGSSPVVITNFAFVKDVYYDFRIVDDGSRISLYLANATTPIASAVTSDRSGYKIGLENRGYVPFFPLFDNQVKLDSFSVSSLSPAPTITTQPAAQTSIENLGAAFRVIAGGTTPVTYQWRKNGVAIAGAIDPSYAIPAVKTTDAGNYSVAVTNNGGTVISSEAALTVVAANPGHLVNLSTLGSGGFTMGFVVGGGTSKNMLIRVVGPTLKVFGVSAAATQTSLTLYSGATILGVNSGWSTAPNAAQMIGAGGSFALTAGSTDSAILTNLAPGSYTAQATGNGSVLVEVYELP